MSWQDEEKEKRILEADKQAHVQNRKEQLLEVQRVKLRPFLEKIFETNGKLDPMLRLSNPIIQNDIDKSFPIIYLDYPSIYVRYDVEDETLYLVEEKEIFYMWGLGELKRRDYKHHAITGRNADSIIDNLLRNRCTKQNVTNGLGSPTMTIRGYEEYTEIIQRQTNPR